MGVGGGSVVVVGGGGRGKGAEVWESRQVCASLAYRLTLSCSAVMSRSSSTSSIRTTARIRGPCWFAVIELDASVFTFGSAMFELAPAAAAAAAAAAVPPMAVVDLRPTAVVATAAGLKTIALNAINPTGSVGSTARGVPSRLRRLLAASGRARLGVARRGVRWAWVVERRRIGRIILRAIGPIGRQGRRARAWGRTACDRIRPRELKVAFRGSEGWPPRGN